MRNEQNLQTKAAYVPEEKNDATILHTEIFIKYFRYPRTKNKSSYNGGNMG